MASKIRLGILLAAFLWVAPACAKKDGKAKVQVNVENVSE